MRIIAGNLRFAKKVATLKIETLDKSFEDGISKKQVVAVDMLLGGFNAHRKEMKDEKKMMEILKQAKEDFENIIEKIVLELNS